MNKEERELLERTIYVEDNGATESIENLVDSSGPVETDETPFMPDIVDNDGHPGYRPAAEANKTFEQDAGLEEPEDENDTAILGDEFEYRMKQHQEAEDEVGAGGSDLSQMHIVHRKQHQALRATANFVRVNPESGFRALLGGQYNMLSGSTATGPRTVAQQVATWSADSEGESQPVTIQFLPIVQILQGVGAAEPLTPPGIITSVRPYGIINFGTRNVYKAEVDIGLGVQLTLGASEVSLQVALDEAPLFAEQSAIVLAGMLSFWTCVRTAPVTRTRYIDALTGAGSTFRVIIPAFAKQLLFWREPFADAVVLTFLDSTNTTVIYSFTLAAGVFMLEPIPVPADAFVLQVQNVTGTAMNARAIFELSL
jgi:hypothetical protein